MYHFVKQNSGFKKQWCCKHCENPSESYKSYKNALSMLLVCIQHLLKELSITVFPFENEEHVRVFDFPVKHITATHFNL